MIFWFLFHFPFRFLLFHLYENALSLENDIVEGKTSLCYFVDGKNDAFSANLFNDFIEYNRFESVFNWAFCNNFQFYFLSSHFIRFISKETFARLSPNTVNIIMPLIFFRFQLVLLYGAFWPTRDGAETWKYEKKIQNDVETSIDDKKTAASTKWFIENVFLLGHEGSDYSKSRPF